MFIMHQWQRFFFWSLQYNYPMMLRQWFIKYFWSIFRIIQWGKLQSLVWSSQSAISREGEGATAVIWQLHFISLLHCFLFCECSRYFMNFNNLQFWIYISSDRVNHSFTFRKDGRNQCNAKKHFVAASFSLLRISQEHFVLH